MFAADLLSITATPSNASNGVQPVAPGAFPKAMGGAMDGGEDNFAALVAQSQATKAEVAPAPADVASKHDLVGAARASSAKSLTEPAFADMMAAATPQAMTATPGPTMPSVSVSRDDQNSPTQDGAEPQPLPDSLTDALQNASIEAAQDMTPAPLMVSLVDTPADVAVTGAPSFRQNGLLSDHPVIAAAKAEAAAHAVEDASPINHMARPADGMTQAPAPGSPKASTTTTAPIIEATEAVATPVAVSPALGKTVEAAAMTPRAPSADTAAQPQAPVEGVVTRSFKAQEPVMTPAAPVSHARSNSSQTDAPVTITPVIAADAETGPSEAVEAGLNAPAPEASKAQAQRASLGLMGATALAATVVAEKVAEPQAKAPIAPSRHETPNVSGANVSAPNAPSSGASSSGAFSPVAQTAAIQNAAVQALTPMMAQARPATRPPGTASSLDPLAPATGGMDTASAEMTPDATADTPDAPAQPLAPSRGARLDAGMRLHDAALSQTRNEAGGSVQPDAKPAPSVVAPTTSTIVDAPSAAAPATPPPAAPAPSLAATAQASLEAPAPDVTGALAATADANAASTSAVRDSGLTGMSRAGADTTAALAAQISRRLDARNTRFDMVLTPEGLGRVDVSLDIASDGRLSARLTFENVHAVHELKGRADELRRQLEDSGFQLSDDALNFSQRDPSSNGGFDRRRGQAFASASRIAVEAETAAAPAARWISSPQTPDGVDMKV